MGLINELGGQPYSFIHTSFTANYNVEMAGGSKYKKRAMQDGLAASARVVHPAIRVTTVCLSSMVSQCN